MSETRTDASAKTLTLAERIAAIPCSCPTCTIRRSAKTAADEVVELRQRLALVEEDNARLKVALDAARAVDSAIRVWTFDDAPEDFRKLSTHGGDEDWLALVPAPIAKSWTEGETYIGWLENGAFGVCDITRHPLPDGSIVVIGAHA